MAEREGKNIMQQGEGVDADYFGSRRGAFAQELAEGIDRANPKPKKQPAPRKKISSKQAAKKKPVDIKDGPAGNDAAENLPKNSKLNKLPEGLRNYLMNKRKGKK